MQIAGTTHCPAGHDMTLPGAWTQVGRRGTHGQCRVCRNSKLRARYFGCSNCGKERPNKYTSFCSPECREIARRRASDSRIGVREIDEQARTLRIIELDEQLWRASTTWEREDIKQRIRELQV